MLSRVADALYWMGRYLERAENLSRLLIVTSEFAAEVEGLDDVLAQAQWDELLVAMDAPMLPSTQFSPASGLSLPYVRALLLDDAVAVSVRHSLRRGRENARSVREAITREIYEGLNECHHELERLRRRSIRDPVAAHRAVADVHRRILTILGSMEHTLSRDQGWIFLKLGEAIERTQRTLRVMAVKLPSLSDEAARGDLPLFYARWRALLRSVASLENYRSARGGGVEPEEAIRFLLFEPAAPRSVLCGVNRIRGYLQGLPRHSALSETDRILGRLHATLLYDEEAILTKQDVVQFCVDASDRIAAVHASLGHQYFPA